MSDSEEVDDIDVETLLRSHGLLTGETQHQQNIVITTPRIPTPIMEAIEEIEEENSEDQDEAEVEVDELLRNFGLLSSQESGTIIVNIPTDSPEPNLTEDASDNEDQDEDQDEDQAEEEAEDQDEEEDGVELDVDELLKTYGLLPKEEFELQSNVDPTQAENEDEDEEEADDIDVNELLAKYGLFPKKQDPFQSSIASTSQDEPRPNMNDDDDDDDVDELLQKFDKLAISENSPLQSIIEDGESEDVDNWMDETTVKEILARYGEEDSRSEDISTPTSPISFNEAIIEVADSENSIDLSSSVVPHNVFKRVFLCKLVGVDALSFVYIRILNKEKDKRFLQQFSHMNAVYCQLDGDMEFLPKNQMKDVSVGQILVAKIYANQHPKFRKVNNRVFIRAKVVEVLKDHFVKVVDVDEQQLHKVKCDNLYPMLKQFYSLPMRIMKCSLYKAEELLGTGTVAAAVALSCQRLDGYFVRIVDIDQETKIPSIILYHSEMELAEVNGHWTYRDDIMKLISEWNKPPYFFTTGMLLTHILITNVTRHGKIWIQLQSEIMEALDDLKPKNQIESQTEIVWKEFQKGETRFVKKLDGKFRRVELMKNEQLAGLKFGSPEEAGDVLVKYIDFGISESADFRDLYSFSTFGKVFQNTPPQGFDAEIKPPPPRKGVQLKEESILEIKSELGLQAYIDEPGPIPVVTLYFPRKGISLDCDAPSKSSLFSCSLLDNEETSKGSYVICKVPVNEEHLLTRSKQNDFDFTAIMDEDDARKLQTNFHMHKTYLQYELIF